MTYYKKTEFGVLLNIALGLISIITIGFFLFQIGSNPIPLIPVLGLTGLFLLIILSFYKLTITIDDKKIEAKFGIGLIKRSLLLSEIDYSTIEEIKVPATYGIGIRITPHGTLYNVKIGNAIKIKSHNKTFFVGTDEYTRIENTLLELQPKE
ncbi:hypothetical protein [Aurantibacter sp.]|uniref:hypothetical protein n=1 Tax=Aurantibacter sp. TaxID=2807103 RepID=UPI0035C7C69A